MKKLPITFRKNTFDYRQVWRDEDHAIYIQEDEGKFIAYEVFKIVRKPERVVFGNKAEATESVPPDSHWGINAWTCGTLEDCYLKVEKMKTAEKQKRDVEEAKNPF